MTAEMDMSDNIPAFAAKNTYGLPFKRGNPSSIFKASAGSGTRCGRWFFMRAPGIVHTARLSAVEVLASRLTSSHVMPRTSPDRAAVRTRKRSACAAMPLRWIRSAHQPDASTTARAGWLSNFATLVGLANNSDRFPFHRAGFSPSRCPATVAQDKTFSRRPRSRDVVSVLSRQIGSKTRSMSCATMSEISFLPNMGFAYRSSVDRHCFWCFSFLKQSQQNFDCAAWRSERYRRAAVCGRARDQEYCPWQSVYQTAFHYCEQTLSLTKGGHNGGIPREATNFAIAACFKDPREHDTAPSKRGWQYMRENRDRGRPNEPSRLRCELAIQDLRRKWGARPGLSLAGSCSRNLCVPAIPPPRSDIRAATRATRPAL